MLHCVSIPLCNLILVMGNHGNGLKHSKGGLIETSECRQQRLRLRLLHLHAVWRVVMYPVLSENHTLIVALRQVSQHSQVVRNEALSVSDPTNHSDLVSGHILLSSRPTNICSLPQVVAGIALPWKIFGHDQIFVHWNSDDHWWHWSPDLVALGTCRSAAHLILCFWAWLGRFRFQPDGMLALSLSGAISIFGDQTLLRLSNGSALGSHLPLWLFLNLAELMGRVLDEKWVAK